MQNNIAIGRLVNNPELRSTNNGMQIAIFNLAINNKKDDTTFLELCASGKLAENIHKYCEKGNRILVNFTIKNNTYEKDGKKVYGFKFWVNKINFIDFKSKKEETEEMPTSINSDEIILTDEDLPF